MLCFVCTSLHFPFYKLSKTDLYLAAQGSSLIFDIMMPTTSNSLYIVMKWNIKIYFVVAALYSIFGLSISTCINFESIRKYNIKINIILYYEKLKRLLYYFECLAYIFHLNERNCIVNTFFIQWKSFYIMKETSVKKIFKHS